MKVKYLIIGAGISGLTFANYCDGNYIIVEKENEVGGYCRTVKRNGFVWDYAGHFFHFKTDEFKKLFMSNYKENELIYTNKCTKIYYNGKLIDFPFQLNIHQLEKDEFIDCLYDLFNKTEKDSYNNFLDMLYGKFGKSIVEKFLKPYNEKLYAVDLKELDVDAMGRFFPYANKEEIINNMKNSSVESYNNVFMYPKNGAGSFMDVLYKKLDSSKVMLKTSLVSINVKEKKALLSNGNYIYYDYLINTMPFNHFLDFLDDGETLKNKLTYNKILVFNIGFDNASPLYKNESWLYVPSKDINFYRCGFYNNILKEKNLSMYIEIGYNKNDIVTDDEINKQYKLTLENLKKMQIISNDMHVVDSMSIIMDPAYVHINSETNKEILKYKEKLAKDNIYSIGRYGAWIYNSMEDSMISAKELAEELR